MDPPPSFRAEVYFLVAKFLENGPCEGAAEALRDEIEQHSLVPPRYDWTGQSHPKTFRHMEEEMGPVPSEYLLQKAFELCRVSAPSDSSVRSLLRREKRSLSASQAHPNVLQRLYNLSTGLQVGSYERQWHQTLAKGLRLLRRTFGHLSSVYCLIFDRTGRLVLTGADDMLVKCWSFTDGRLIHTFRGASSEISDLAVSHDNRLVAAGSCDRVIRVWNLHTGCPVTVLTRHTGSITAINFCPYLLNTDGSHYLASTSGDGTVSFWRYRYDESRHGREACFDDLPTRYHEKIRPGSTQMICASFSPGGVFFCVGSADHNVRVYKMTGPDGPQRILEEEAHDDRVDSIQWCNTPNELKFLSGSRDGTARIWTFAHQKWTTLVLNMRTGDNKEPQQTTRPSNATTSSASTSSSAANPSTSRSARQQNQTDQQRQNARRGQAAVDASQTDGSVEKKQKSVTMVAWSRDDALAITAVSDLTLKIWDAHKGHLLSQLVGYEDEIFVLEPHPTALNLLLTASHDGNIMVWDMNSSTCLYKHRNMIEEQGNTQGHGPVFDAKWSTDGTTICASDSHGHVLFIGHGSSERFDRNPIELFFHTDYRPLLRDSFHNVVDEQTQLPPHLLPPPFLVDSEGDPYPPYIQRLVRGRENMSDREALVPLGPEPSFNQQQPHQQQQIQQPPENRASSSSSTPEPDDTDNSGPEHRLDRFRDEMQRDLQIRTGHNSGQMQQQEPERNSPMRVNKLVILNDQVNKTEVQEGILNCKAFSLLESALFVTETNKVAFDHDYVKNASAKDKNKKSKNSRSRREERERARAADTARNEEDDEEEENGENGEDEEETSDCSLDESDFSSAESTTDVSSEHSDWGSDTSRPKSPRHQQAAPLPAKKKSPKNKKKRGAAQRCREKLLTPGGDIGEEFMPSPWLSEAIPRKSPYFPQVGDILMYFKKGHGRYIELVNERQTYKVNMKEQAWMRKKNLDESCMVKVADIHFEIKPPRLCVMKLSILNQSTSRPTGESFSIKYHDMNDVVDFLVLYQTYNSYKGKHWKKGDRIRSQIDDCWWKGTVQKVEYHDGSKKSPFLSIFVHWDNGDKEYLSPWDLEVLDNDSKDLQDGVAATPEQLKSCLYIPTSEEWNNIGSESECTRISEALATIMELAISEPFNYPVDVTAYPEYMLDVEYPMDLSLIKARVDNHFYRRIHAIKHDVNYIYSNAASFNRPRSDIVRNAKIISQLANEIVGDTTKTKDDVSSIYHRLVERFKWDTSDEESDDEEASDSPRSSRRSARRRSSSSGKNKSPQNLNPKKWKHDCNELLNEMVALPFSVPFREPVSEMDFPDYHRYVATPMDLSTVRESLHIGDYSSPLDFQKDVKLVFNNSKEYNTNPKSKVLAMTFKLEDWFDQRLGDLINDWRNTTRRLTLAKRKHKAKRQQDQSPDIKGKGKGKGKGQSSKINQKKKIVRNHDSEQDSESETTTTPDKRRAQRSRKMHSSGDEEEDDEDEDEDDIHPRPGPSKKSKELINTSTASSASSAGTHTLNGHHDLDSSRRTSSRQSKPPVRFQEFETEGGQVGIGEDGEAPRRTSDRSTKSRVSMREDEDWEAAGPSTLNETKAKTVNGVSNDDDEEEVPLIHKRKRKAPTDEDEPLVKRAAKKYKEESSEEDIPLARKKTGKEDIPSPTSSTQSTQRPVRKAKKFAATMNFDDSGEEENDRQPLRRQQQQQPKGKKTVLRFDHDSSEDSSPRRRRRKAKQKKGKKPPVAKRRKKQSEESVSEFSDSDEDEEEEGDSGSSDDEEVRRKSSSSARRSPVKPQRRAVAVVKRARPTRVYHEPEDEEEESEEEILPQRQKRQMAKRNDRLRRGAPPVQSTSDSLPSRRNVKRPTYYEGDDSEEDNRRPKRQAASLASRRKFLQESDDDDDEDEEEKNNSPSAADSGEDVSGEEAYLRRKKTTVTSRGRVSKPNPRII